jgi:small subunit ribosomal protein S17
MSETQVQNAPAAGRGRRQSLEGVVISDKMTKTVVVEVGRVVRNPRYGSYSRTSARFMAHDEKGQCRMGDRVTIVESRPLSRRKRWTIRSIVSRAARD